MQLKKHHLLLNPSNLNQSFTFCEAQKIYFIIWNIRFSLHLPAHFVFLESAVRGGSNTPLPQGHRLTAIIWRSQIEAEARWTFSTNEGNQIAWKLFQRNTGKFQSWIKKDTKVDVRKVVPSWWLVSQLRIRPKL